jgi:hypothetical protein
LRPALRDAAGNWNAFDLWMPAVVMVTLVVGFQTLAFAVRSAFAMGRVADLREFQLFDSRAADPLVRFGLRTAVLFGVTPMIILGGTWAVGAGQLNTAILSFAINVTVVAFCMVVPVHRQRLQWPRVFRGSGSSTCSRTDARWKPFRPGRFGGSTLARFAAYVILPRASWAAAAFVERLSDDLISR